MTSSPESASIINSFDSFPPIAPESASTITTSVEHLLNIFLYAWIIFLYEISNPSKSLSKEYASFISNSLTLKSPPLGLGSSLYFV